ncbi:hypothetical protein KKH39_02600 [Patescibacteria group bacterium]|nr:hypothetical protein [Patescibacteria group bacterium]
MAMETMEQSQVEQEDALSTQEVIDLAQKAIDELDSEKATEEFPGADAYKRVMKIVVLSGADGKVIENWQVGYEELSAKYKKLGEGDRAEFLVENNLQSMLQGALDSAQRKVEESK